MMKETVSAENFQIKWLMNTNINFKTKKKKKSLEIQLYIAIISK